MYGWTGNILRVNLSSGSVTREHTDLNWQNSTSAGAAWETRIFSDEVDPLVDPLSPETK